MIMKRFLLLILMAIVCLGIRCHGEGPRDVPDIAPQEAQRRGSHVEETGTIRSGLMASAFAPPADYSARWFVTLVYKPTEPKSEALKKTIETDPDVKRWIDAANPNTSYTHYQARSTEDATQADWIKGVEGAIKQYGVPLVVVQPPRNGQFGEAKIIVKILGGPMTGKELSAKLTESVKTYVTELQKPIRIGITEQVIGGAPPFNVPGPNAPAPPVQPSTPFEWPPSAPTALTVDQVRAACPGAPSEFVLQVIDAKTTDINVVKLMYEVYQAKHPIQPPELLPEAEVVPARPEASPAFRLPPMDLLVLSIVASLIVVILNRLADRFLAPAGTRGISPTQRALETMTAVRRMEQAELDSASMNTMTRSPAPNAWKASGGTANTSGS
jgi:hypothetical protein